MDMTLTPRQEEIKAAARSVGEELRPFANDWDIANHVPLADITKRMLDVGLGGITIPKEYGGQDLTTIEYTIAVEEAIRGSTSWAAGEPMFRTSGAGPSICLMSDNETPRKKFLPQMMSGEKGCSLVLTEPDHGSDASMLETRMVKDGDEYVINGSKRFITGAIEDEFYATFVRISDVPGPKGIGAVMVEKGTPGFTMDKGPEFMGSRGIPHGDLWFEDCRVPAENLLVAEGQFPRLMTAFNMERLHNGASCLGFAEAAFDESAKYARNRKQFGRPIIEFQAIYHMLAEIWTSIEAARYLVYNAAASSIDGKFPAPMQATTAKLFANEMLLDVTVKAVEIHGGDGTRRDFAVQRIRRDAIICAIAGGTKQIAKNVIAGMLYTDHKFPQTRA